MKKDKRLYRKYRSSQDDDYISDKHKSDKNIDLFSDLPFHKGMGKKYRNGYDYKPLQEFIKSKMGENWDDVFPEILSKINKKYRYELDWILDCYIPRAVYDDFFVPRNKRGYMLYNQSFIDINNIIVFKTREEIESESKKYYKKYSRLEKLKEIMNSDENQEEISNNDNGLFESE